MHWQETSPKTFTRRPAAHLMSLRGRDVCVSFLQKLATLFCATAVVCCGLAMAKLGRTGVFNILIDVMATIAAPISVPLVLGLFLRRVPLAAPFIAIGGRFLCFTLNLPFPAAVGYQAVEFPAPSRSGHNCKSGYLPRRASAAPARPSDACDGAGVFSRRDRPVDFAAEIGEANDNRQLRIIGAFGAALGLAVPAFAHSRQQCGSC